MRVIAIYFLVAANHVEYPVTAGVLRECLFSILGREQRLQGLGKAVFSAGLL